MTEIIKIQKDDKKLKLTCNFTNEENKNDLNIKDELNIYKELIQKEEITDELSFIFKFPEIKVLEQKDNCLVIEATFYYWNENDFNFDYKSFKLPKQFSVDEYKKYINDDALLNFRKPNVKNAETLIDYYNFEMNKEAISDQYFNVVEKEIVFPEFVKQNKIFNFFLNQKQFANIFLLNIYNSIFKNYIFRKEKLVITDNDIQRWTKFEDEAKKIITKEAKVSNDLELNKEVILTYVVYDHLVILNKNNEEFPNKDFREKYTKSFKSKIKNTLI